MRAWWVVSGLLGWGLAFAQDANSDGCVDARFDADAACVHPNAVVDPTVAMGTGAFVGEGASVGAGTVLGDSASIGDFANVAGQGMAGVPSVIGARSVIGRRAQLGSDATLAEDTTLGRVVVIGTDFETGLGAWVGYGAEIGDHVEVGASSVIGNLVSVGSWTTLGDAAVLARGTIVDAGSGDGDRTVINGVVGPGTRIGAGAFISAGARVRKDAVIGAGAQITGGARIGRNVQIGPRTTVSSSAVIRADVTICNDTTVPDDVVVRRGETYPAEGCPCEPGYAGPPGSCVDIDECADATDDCGAFSDCVNTPGAFECDCQLGYVADVNGECTAVDADIVGDFGADLAHQAPNSVLNSSSTVVVDGFEGELDVGIQTTGSGPAAVVQAFRDGTWQPVTTVVAGDELRVRIVAPPGTGQSRSVVVTLFVGPTNVWVSPAWGLSTWTYSATGVSYGSCSASCGGGSQSPSSWSCNRSDGTTGHAQSNCSGGGSVSCNTGNCPFNARRNGTMVTIRDPLTNVDRYDVTCRNGGNGNSQVQGPGGYTVMSPLSVSANASSKEITVQIGNASARTGWYRMRFSGTSNLSVSSFNPGASGRHPYMCRQTSTLISQCDDYTSTHPQDPQNCSSYIFCRVRDRNSGAYIYTSSLSGFRAIHCPGVTLPSAMQLPPNAW